MFLNFVKHWACKFFKFFTYLEKFRQTIRNKISEVFLPMQLHPICCTLRSFDRNSAINLGQFVNEIVCGMFALLSLYMETSSYHFHRCYKNICKNSEPQPRPLFSTWKGENPLSDLYLRTNRNQEFSHRKNLPNFLSYCRYI
jgi:hypothetical protein